MSGLCVVCILRSFGIKNINVPNKPQITSFNQCYINIIMITEPLSIWIIIYNIIYYYPYTYRSRDFMILLWIYTKHTSIMYSQQLLKDSWEFRDVRVSRLRSPSDCPVVSTCTAVLSLVLFNFVVEMCDSSDSCSGVFRDMACFEHLHMYCCYNASRT